MTHIDLTATPDDSFPDLTGVFPDLTGTYWGWWNRVEERWWGQPAGLQWPGCLYEFRADAEEAMSVVEKLGDEPGTWEVREWDADQAKHEEELERLLTENI